MPTHVPGPARALLVVLAACAVLVAGVVALSTPARADTVTPGGAPPLRFVSYNICGHYCTAAKGYDNQRRIDAVVEQAAGSSWNADQIHLQEVCRPQYEAVRQRLAPLGFEGLFTATRSGESDICAGADYGVAVLVKGRITETEVLDVTVGPEVEPIRIPCVKNYIQNRVNWACSVHLYWVEAEYREAEARALAARTAVWESQGIPVVLGGDFNARPDTPTLATFYDKAQHMGGQGTFVEADDSDAAHFPSSCSGLLRCRSGEPTFAGRKIDYLMVSSRFFRGAKADALPLDTAVSDHQVLRGAAFWSDCLPGSEAAGEVFRRDVGGNLYRYAGRPGGSVAGACKVGVGWSGMRLLTDDGTAVLAVDEAGTLWRYPSDGQSGQYSGGTRVAVSSGWQGMNGLLAPGDFSGDGRADLIGRDEAGALWLYEGDGAGSYAPREKIGTGWQMFSALLAPGDFSGDGRADLIGRDEAGALWLYEGDGAGSYAPREKIGTGWQVYQALVAPGDLDGDGRADLAGRDEAGDLWSYRGDGAGSYSPRVKIGYGYPAGELLF